MGLLLTARVLDLNESCARFDAEAMLPDCARYVHVEHAFPQSRLPVRVGENSLSKINLIAIHTSKPIHIILDNSIERVSVGNLYFAAGLDARSLEIVAPDGADISILLGGE